MLEKKSPSFGLLSTNADQIFLLNAFQTFLSKATGKIKPTKSYSDYYVFLCSFLIGLMGQLCIFLHFEKQLNSMIDIELNW